MLLVASVVMVGTRALAADVPNPASQTGAILYRRYCAACHGESGRGDGPVSPALAQKVPDLTTIAVDAGGKFPFIRVAEAIDGRTEIRAHGVTEMPVWGEALGTGDAKDDPLKTASEKVLLITEYLRTIQR